MRQPRIMVFSREGAVLDSYYGPVPQIGDHIESKRNNWTVSVDEICHVTTSAGSDDPFVASELAEVQVFTQPVEST